jgi:hypothetical protein
LKVEWIEQRWMLSASLGVDLNDVALTAANAIASDASSDCQSESPVDDGMIELSSTDAVTGSLTSRETFGLTFDAAAADEVFATFNGFLDLPLAEPCLAPPPLQRILDVGPSAPSGGGGGLPSDRPVESTFSDRAMEKPLRASPDATPPTADRRVERPLPIVGLLPPSARPDGGGMIDITPRPGQAEVLLARDEPPALDRDPLLARSADPARRPAAEPSDARVEKNSPAMRVEGSQGRGQAFDLAWRAAQSPSRPMLDTADGGSGVVWTAASVPAERVPERPLPAEHSTSEPPTRALPETKAADLIPEAPTVTDETASPDDHVAVAPPAPPAAHDVALRDLGQWLADSLPCLAMADARRAQEFIPLVVLATVGQYHAQAVLPDRSAPSELFPPRRKGR